MNNYMTFEQGEINKIGQRLITWLNGAAEAANIGILVQALGGWFPTFAAFVAATPLTYLMLIGDPAIYFLRSLSCVVKFIGKKLFGLQFEEEKHGPLHPGYTAANVLTLCCFILAIALFCGAFIAPPVGITLAWAIGLLGRSCQGYFDYYYPEQQALKKLTDLECPETGFSVNLVRGITEQQKREAARAHTPLVAKLKDCFIIYGENGDGSWTEKEFTCSSLPREEFDNLNKFFPEKGNADAQTVNALFIKTLKRGHIKQARFQETEQAREEYTNARNSRRLFMAVLFGLALLLLCGSAVAFAPPVLIPILGVVSNLASLGLGIVFCMRGYRGLKEWLQSKKAHPQHKLKHDPRDEGLDIEIEEKPVYNRHHRPPRSPRWWESAFFNQYNYSKRKVPDSTSHTPSESPKVYVYRPS